jgi:hypothetical protein
MFGNELICCPHSIVHIYLSISYKFKLNKLSTYESALKTRKQPLPVLCRFVFVKGTAVIG